MAWSASEVAACLAGCWCCAGLGFVVVGLSGVVEAVGPLVLSVGPRKVVMLEGKMSILKQIKLE